MHPLRNAAFLTLAALSVCQAQVPSDAAGTPINFGTFEFVIPAKWSRAKPDRAKTAAMLLLNGTAWNNADGMILVDVGKPTASARELAQSLAGKDGKIYPDKVAVDGVDGIKVESTSDNLSRPKYAVVVLRDSKVYLIMAAQLPGTNVSEALNQIVKSWKWKQEK
jgi:hypothetical protein